ncbi:MAG: hypothetical protein HY774_14925 [Acidobacteria bacterium]|nr:hypothetical protein [Acidobacteriota bacterium]
MKIDAAGRLYVADTGNNRILQFAGGNAGLAITYGGTGSGIGGLAGQFRNPEGVVFAGFTTGMFAGGMTLVVGDTANNRVQARKLPGGAWTLVAGTPNPPQSATTGSGVGQGSGHHQDQMTR